MASTMQARMVNTLNNPIDWVNWNEEFRALARNLDVWSFIDPARYEELVEPRPPARIAALEDMPSELLQTDEEEQFEETQTEAIEVIAESSTTGSRKRRTPGSAPAPPPAPEPTPDLRNAEIDRQIRRAGYQFQVYNAENATYLRKKAAIREMEGALRHSINKEYLEIIAPLHDLRSSYRELERRLRPLTREVKTQLTSNLQNLLTATEIKNSVLSEWCRKVEEAWRRCKNNHVQRYADDDQTIDEMLMVIEKRFAMFAAITRDNIERGDQIDPPRLLDRLRRNNPDQPVTKVNMASNFRLNGNPSEGNSNSTLSAKSGNSRKPRKECMFCGRNHVPAQDRDHWRSCWMCLPETCPARFAHFLTHEGLQRKTREAIAKQPTEVQEAIAKARADHLAKEVGSEAPEVEAEATATNKKKVSFAGSITMKTVAPISQRDDTIIILDSGCQNHVFEDPSWFVSIEESDEIVEGAYQRRGQAAGKGTVVINLPNNHELVLHNVLYAPGLGINGISAKRMMDKNIFWNNETDEVYLRKDGAKLVAFNVSWINDQPRVPWESRPSNPVTISAAITSSNKPKPLIASTAELWHNRLGHPGADTFNHILERTQGVEVTKPLPSLVNCEVCRTSKATRDISRIPREESFPKMPFACISVDLFAMGIAYNGDRYMWLATCRHTGYRTAIMLREKTAFNWALVTMINQVKRSYNIDICMVLMDNEAAFEKAQKQALEATGIQFLPNSPYHPHQGGHQERSGGITKELATSLRLQAGIPQEFWNTACMMAIYLLNRRPRKLRGWQAPIEMIHLWLREYRPEWHHLSEDQRPDLRHLRAFGCKAYVMTRERVTGRANKLEQRAHIALRKGTVINSSHVTFDETSFYSDEEARQQVLEPAKLQQFIDEAANEAANQETVQSDLQQLTAAASSLLESGDFDLFQSSRGEAPAETPPAEAQIDVEITPDSPHTPETPEAR
ncbi:hypothetical protein PWT90_09880 [Aphanocladium album]|nr:hypothetical protein PWT90_09880 [Aphanocladium album]